MQTATEEQNNNAVELPDHWKSIATKLFLLIGVGMVGIGIYIQYTPQQKSGTLLVGSTLNIDQNSAKGIQTHQEISNSSPSASTLISTVINVDVSGAVVNPGVFKLATDERLTGALAAASGLSKSADTAWVARNLNLATKLKDGDKIYIPSKGELKSPPPVTVQQSQSALSPQLFTSTPQVAGVTTGSIGYSNSLDTTPDSPSPIAQTDSKISVNTANSKELDTLPGVGEVTAQKIIDKRPYTKLEELKEKKAVNKSTYDKIIDKIKL